MKSFKKTAIALLVASSFSVSTPTYAGSDTPAILAIGNQISTGVAAAGSLIAGWLSSINTMIYGFLTTEAAQLHADSEKQNAVTVATAQAQTEYIAQKDFQRDANLIEERTADMGNACKSANIGTKVNSAAMEAQDYAAYLNQSALSRNMNTERVSGEVAGRWAEHMNEYCSAEDVARGRKCTPQTDGMANADLLATTLLTPNAAQTYSDKQLRAANSYKKTLINPLPTAALPVGWEKTPQGKAFVVAQQVEQARLSLAENSLNASIASRTRNTGIGNAMKAAGLNITDPSEKAVMKHYASNFVDPKWHASVSNAVSSEAIQKEGVRLAAYRNYQDYKAYEQMERIENLLAVSVSMDVKNNSNPLTQTQRNAAANAAGRMTQ